MDLETEEEDIARTKIYLNPEGNLPSSEKFTALSPTPPKSKKEE